MVEWEVGLENVVDYSRVCCEELAGAEATVEEEGGGGGGMEYVGDPLDAVMLVCYDGQHGTDDRIGFGNGGGGGGRRRGRWFGFN